jgi:sugar phosphate permease
MNNETIQFLLTTVMEIGTLLCAYLGVRLFKKNQWLRIALIIVPLVLNIVLYFIYRTTPFFYLGIILLLCIPFVWPRKSA